eukprot:m.131248 g.131248  ORF g.131248 m.131248 type:complete len:92 (-) comp16810_c0_seq3:63-338(-)
MIACNAASPPWIKCVCLLPLLPLPSRETCSPWTLSSVQAIDKHQAELTHIKEHVKVVVDKSIAKTQRHQLEETNKASTSSLDTSANAPRTT